MKKRNLILLLTLVAITLGAFATPPTPPPGLKWELSQQYSDEFDGTSLDLTKWRKEHPFWNGRTPAWFNPASISVSGGYMQIQNGVLDQPFNGFNIYGGAVTSVNENTKFAYYECKLKASSTRMSTTFWLENRKAPVPGGCTGDSYSQEIDIVETIGESTNSSFYNSMKSNTHYRWKDCNGGDEQFFSNKKDGLTISPRSNEAFHTYGAWWKNANEITFYLDDQTGPTVPFRTDKDPTPFDRGMFICMVTETYNWEATPLNWRLQDPNLNTSYYDWVRVWVLVPDDGQPVAVTDVSVSPNTAALEVGETTSLTASVAPSNATNKTVSWSSSNTNVATVSGGTVTAVAAGNANIIVTTQDGNKTASCAVTVSTSTGTTVNLSAIEDAYLENGILKNTAELRTEAGKRVTYLKFNLSALSGSVISADLKLTSNNDNGNGPITVTKGSHSNWTEANLATNAPSSAGNLGSLNVTFGEQTAYTWSLDASSIATGGMLTLIITHTGSNDVSFHSDEASSTANKPVLTLKTSTGSGDVSVTGVSISPTTLSLVDGNTGNLSASIAPTDATDKLVSWGSSNTAIATVNGSGVVTAQSPGNANIIVTTNDGGFTATSAVTVSAASISVSGISVSPTAATLTSSGATQLVNASVTPSNATNKSVDWISSNTAIATVNGSGVVTAVSNGSSIITATTVDGGFTATSTITVDIPASGCDLPYNNAGFTVEKQTTNWSSAAIDISCASSVAISMNVKGEGSMENADYCNIYYKVNGGAQQTLSENVNAFAQKTVSVAGVSGNSLEIIINAYTSWQDEVYTLSNINVVSEGPSGPISVTGIIVSPNSLSLVEGNSANLSATVSPSDATNKVVSWNSSNINIATVNTSGVVTAIAEGSTSITATTDDGGFTSIASVSVSAVPTSSNLLSNFDFETGNLNSWNTWGTVSVVANNQHGGSYAVTVDGAGAPSQNISVQANTTYTLSAWGKVAASGQFVYLGVKNHDAAESAIQINTTSYSQGSHTFTTGANATTAQIYFYCPNASYQAWGDDFELIEGTKSASDKVSVDKQELDLILYPNPVEGLLNIAFSKTTENMQLYLYNHSGMLIRSHSVNEQNLTMDLNDLSDGLYIIRLIVGSEQITETFIKQ